MARAQKVSSRSTPIWMIIYTDLMTLLLTFFVLLISMSQLDERRVRDYLISTKSAAPFGDDIFNPLSKKDTKSDVQPGPMDVSDLESIREFIWENKDEDVNLETNRDIAIISIGEDTLFPSGSAFISDEGRIILDRLASQIQDIEYPMLVAGHSSTLRDESEGDVDTRITLDGSSLSPTWKLSINRALAVYEYFKSKNLNGVELMNEGFGEYRPKVSNNTSVGRKVNRRVDLVLDRRNKKNIVRDPREVEKENMDVYKFKDFRFRLDVTPPPSSEMRMEITPTPPLLEDKSEAN